MVDRSLREIRVSLLRPATLISTALRGDVDLIGVIDFHSRSTTSRLLVASPAGGGKIDIGMTDRDPFQVIRA